MQDYSALAGRRYVLRDRIGEGGMGVVYRAVDRLYGREVALKRLALAKASSFADLAHRKTDSVRPAAEHTSSLQSTADPAISEELRLALAQEFHTLASLRHPNIISVLDYGFDEARQPFFTMELLHDAKLISVAAASLPMGKRVELLLQVLHALIYLHRRGVLHRDLKPANILVVAEAKGPRAKLLDFGLAVLRNQLRTSDGEVSGTLGYIAPEVMYGAAPSYSSDLYAFGVICFELLVGRALFPLEKNGQLVLSITSEEIDWSTTGLPPALREFLQRLLSPTPAARYPSAEATAQALQEAAAAPPAADAEDTRDSFLQAAELVGRESELALLRGALTDVMQGQGSSWLIGGESGVGKSRLCDELRTQAQVRGARVLRGQAVVHSGAGVSLFSEALRALSLEVELGELDASVLKTVVTDLPALLDRPIADAPLLSAQAARLRLLQVVESILLRSQSPLVLLLEDLHWAEPDDLDLLRRITTQASTRSLLVLGTFRDEERPGLPDELPAAQVLKLSRLNPEAVGVLVTSMLGATGRKSELVELLLRESAGNTYFIVEIMRVLAEEAGGLARIVQRVLPQKVFAGGVQTALQRRLAQVPPTIQPLLRFAAVAGRQVDVRVLQAAALTSDVEAWLQRCSDVAVLELSEQQWRFSHDKLRERLLADLTPAQRSSLHAAVADAIAAAYADRAPHAATLAYHYEQAGDLKHAGHYAALAGELSVQRGALSDARNLLERALNLFDHTGASHAARVRLYRLLIGALLGLGYLEDCEGVLRRALGHLGRPLPADAARLSLSILREAARQGLHRLHPAFIQRATSRDEAAVFEEFIRVYVAMGEYFCWQNKPLEGVYGFLLATNTADRHGSPLRKAIGFSLLAIATSLTPLRTIYNYYIAQAEQVGDIESDSDSEATNLYQRAMAYCYLQVGRTTDSLRVAEQALNLAHEVGDLYAQMHLLLIKWDATRIFGDLLTARKTAESMMAMAKATENLHFQTWAHGLLGGDLLRTGNFAEARFHLEAAAALSTSGGYREGGVYHAGLRALCALRQNDRNQAHELGDEALRQTEGKLFAHNGAHDGYPACAETFLLLWETSTEPAERKVLEKKLKRALRVLQLYSLIFVNGRPCLYLLEGRYHWRRGDRQSGKRDIERSAQTADQLGMRYEAALANAWRGRVTGGTLGSATLLHAQKRLRALGAVWDAAQIESEGERFVV